MILQLQKACDMLKKEYDQEMQKLTDLDKRLEQLEQEDIRFCKRR